ncbi:MAG: 2-C-methyl-D-erythritol 2,4-cyclodiphosphate synthase [Balneolaceae bacterium]|nr:2-C-methyl-D-erythritol 2,4-cyclodiphosphate synthase [Balneolaceae bacterium]
MSSNIRIGIGYDVHRLVEGRKLILGGVEIPHRLGLAGHSDADVLLHAICDALLGALALGDIGKHFPDTDPEYKNVDSRVLFREVMKLIAKKGYHIINIDSTVIAQQPKLASYIQNMRANIAEDAGIDIKMVNVKATTSEELGFEGKEKGISAQAVALIGK